MGGDSTEFRAILLMARKAEDGGFSRPGPQPSNACSTPSHVQPDLRYFANTFILMTLCH